jgi:hypothetical protein
MKNKIALALIAIGLAASAFGQDFHYNRGYIDSNGNYHSGHFQTNPNGNPYDNWSTYPNYNPFTGKQGTVTPPTGPHYDASGVYHPY